MQSAVSEGCLAKHQELEEDNESCDDEEDEESTSIMSFDRAVTHAGNLMNFMDEKGEDKAAEYQHKVISAL